MQTFGGKPGIRVSFGPIAPTHRLAPASPPASGGSDPALLARIGAAVNARLEATSGMERLPATGLDMFMMRDFLAPAECRTLIAMIDADIRPSQLVIRNADPRVRTSETCELPIYDPLVAAVEKRFSALFGIPLVQSESPQGQRYRPGQHFAFHSDYFAPGAAYTDGVLVQGGQRSWTAMVYLNAPEAGGQTRFPKAGIDVAPMPGALLAWNNMDRQGRPNPHANHEGARVERGSKYVLTKWFRERRWTGWGQIDPDRIVPRP